jgi:hypothetical protein
MRFYVWPKLTAFDEQTVGSKVIDSQGFFNALSEAVLTFDFQAQRTPGQGVVPLDDAVSYVSAGVGPKSSRPEDHVLREWRGDVKAFLRREHAAVVSSLSVVVYTASAYLADPDIEEDEVKLVRESGATHCVVAVLANAGPKPPAYGPGRLVANLAGGNRDALTWTADEIRAKARESKNYADKWSVVAD